MNNFSEGPLTQSAQLKLKIVLIGSQKSGKTSIASRLAVSNRSKLIDICSTVNSMKDTMQQRA